MAKERQTLTIQQGQVTAEFVVSVMFILLPLMIAVPTLGKYLDARHKTEVAARYAAWERTAWFADERDGGHGAVKAAAEIRAQVDHRVFAPRRAPIHAGQASGHANAPAILHHSHGAGSAYQSLLRRPDDHDGFAAVGLKEIETPGWGRGVDTVLRTVGAVSGGRFDLGDGGSHTARVAVGVHTPETIEALDGVELEFSREATLLADGWNAGGPNHNERRVAGLVPSEVLDTDIMDFLTTDVATTIAIFYPPAASLIELDFGKVDVEPVPPQYLE